MWNRYTTLLLAVAFVAAGLLGFVPSLLTPPSPDSALVVDSLHGNLFGIFPVNVLHDAVHLAFALWGFFAFFSGVQASRIFLRGTAVIYAVLTVMGFIPGLDTVFGLVPLQGNDIWLHAAITVVAGAVGFFVTERYATPAGESARQM